MRPPTPVLVLLLSGALGACNADVVCTGNAESFDSTSNTCSIDWTECDDEHEYAVLCVGTACSCLLDGVEVDSFAHTDSCVLAELTETTVNEQCGWSLAAGGDG